MSDGTAPTPIPGPPGILEGWGANYKILFDQMLTRLSEHDQIFDDARAHRDAIFEKVITDAQSAANLALLNAVNNSDALAKQALNNSDLLAKQAVRHCEIAAADQWGEQAEEEDVTIDDVAKVFESTTAVLVQTLTSQTNALAGIAAAMQAIASSMATGRPVTNPTGTVNTPIAST